MAFRTTLAAALSSGLLAAVCAAQAPITRSDPVQAQPIPPVTTLKLASRLVTLAVNAVDTQGAPVGDLERQDFRLLENGVEQKISFFEKESSTPLSIVLSIDGSGSLKRNERLEKEAAKKFVNTLLRPQDELDLMEFSDAVTELVPFTSDKQRIESGLGRLTEGGATAMYDAIFLASKSLGATRQDDGRRRVLVLITDGGDTVHGVQYDQAVEAAQRAGVMIYALIVIPIYADAGRNTGGEHALIQMCQDTGGKFFLHRRRQGPAPSLRAGVGRSPHPVRARLLRAGALQPAARRRLPHHQGRARRPGRAGEDQDALPQWLLRPEASTLRLQP